MLTNSKCFPFNVYFYNKFGTTFYQISFLHSWTHPFLFLHLGLNEGVECNTSNCNAGTNTSLCGNFVTCNVRIV